MNTLGTPLEALALNYLSYGFLTAVNNVWTWLALLTAAVSFWRLKASSDSPPPPPAPRPNFPNGSSNLPPTPPPRNITLSSPSPAPPVDGRLSAEPASTSGEPSKAAAKANTTSFGKREGLTRGKFTAYFDGDDESKGNAGGVVDVYECEGNANDDGSNGDVKEWYESWERVMKTKTGVEGWYRNQDLTVINGNVVRLWDGGCRRRSATALVAVGCVVSTW